MSAEAQQRYRERYPERAKAAVVKWKREHPEEIRAEHKRWRKQNPEKRLAYLAIDNALRRGTMKKGHCQECGAAKVHAHHPNGYLGPHKRDIVWLCPAHHSAVHREARP